MQEARLFAENKQQEKVNKLNFCVDNVKDIKDGSDFMLKYRNCYLEFQNDLVMLEREVKVEFNNFI